MKTYKTFDEIDLNLKRLKLERQIGLEEMKGIKGDFSNDLKPMNWVSTAASFAGKYGMFILLKKLFR